MSAVKADVKDITETRKSITVSFTSEEVDEQEAKLVKDFQREARIPGFRSGKAPESVVRSRYAKDIKEELKNRVVTQAHEEGVDKSGLQVFDIVELDEGEIVAGADTQVTFTVDVIPEFELPEYEGLRVTSGLVEVGEEEIDETIDQIIRQRAEYNVVEKAAKKGDYARCSYEGKVGDELVAELAPETPIYGSQKMTWEEAGSEEAPGVRAIIDGLIGMSAGDEKEVTMDFPEDFEPESLAGKSATYALTVEEVREKVLPEINEEFLQSLDMESEEDLRKDIAQGIENQKQLENADAEHQQITEALLRLVDFPLPKSGLESETEEVLREFMVRSAQQGIPYEKFEEHKERLHADASRTAHNRLKSRFILSKIAEKEKVKAEQEDFIHMITTEAERRDERPEKLLKELKKDRTQVDLLRRNIILGKTLELLVEKAERIEPARNHPQINETAGNVASPPDQKPESPAPGGCDCCDEAPPSISS